MGTGAEVVLVSGLASSALDGIGSIGKATEHARALRQQALATKRQKEEFLKRSEQNIEQVEREAAIVKGKNVAAAAASGIRGDVNIQIELDNAARAIEQQAIMREDALYQASVMDANAASLLNQSKSTIHNALLSGVTTFGKGAAKSALTAGSL